MNGQDEGERREKGGETWSAIEREKGKSAFDLIVH